VSLEKTLKNKLEGLGMPPPPLTAHDIILQPVDIPAAPAPVSRSRSRKRVKFTDLHTQQNFYIENTVLDVLNEIIGDAWGEKSRLANDAFKLFIQKEYPELAHKLNGAADSH
jgi:hypothetical protein